MTRPCPPLVRARDLFSGAGGWCLAAGQLGWSVDGVENNPAAEATRDAAGLTTVGSDVRDVQPVAGDYDVDIASPPCQSFSMAGGGSGRRALSVVLAGIEGYDVGKPPTSAQLTTATGDERTGLVLEPLRVALAGRSPYLAWEQVPAVLPVWSACAELLRTVGYSVATGVLNAEQFGVPQTRRRAVLVARSDGGTAALPTPTHSRYHSRTPGRLDDGVKPWVPMAAAMAWSDELAAVSNYGTGGDPRNRGVRTCNEPAATVTSKADRTKLRRRDGTTRNLTATEAAVLQSFPPGHPFRGTKTERMEQIGNAMPPLLALAVLEALGVPA